MRLWLLALTAAVAAAAESGPACSFGGFDLAPLHVPAHPAALAQARRGLDQSIASLPFWSARVAAGTLALNVCGEVQNAHGDCPDGQALVLLNPQAADPEHTESAAHRREHCVGWGAVDSARFVPGADPRLGFRLELSGGSGERSASIDFVCGRSTGELTAFEPSSLGDNAHARVTFVTKYACPPAENADEARIERQRRKEADRKARQKLQQNYASLKQARLESPQRSSSAAQAAKADGSGGLASASLPSSGAAASAGSSSGKARKGFARMRELGLHDVRAAGSKSLDALIDERRRKHQQEQQLLKNQIKSQKMRADMKANQAKPSGESIPGQTQSTSSSRFPDRGRTQSGSKDPVSLDVYQQLLAKMREKAAKDGVSAEQAAQASARASADIERDPVQLQMGPRKTFGEGSAPVEPVKLDDDEPDRLAQRHAAMRQAAKRYDSGPKKPSVVRGDGASGGGKSVGQQVQREQEPTLPAPPTPLPAPPLMQRLSSQPIFNSQTQSNQLLLVLLLLVAAALGVAWYRAKVEERRLLAATARIGGGSNVFEYNEAKDFEARSTQYSYEKFVAELASKPASGGLGRARSVGSSLSASDGALDLDDDDAADESEFGSLLPPAPGTQRTGLHRRGNNAQKND